MEILKMTPGEIYDTKRKNFLENALKHFAFLVSEFGYREPVYEFYKQENGVVIKDEFKYENKAADRLIIVSNSYHPVDFGFEICVYKASRAILYDKREIAYSQLKENQDTEQSYLAEAATILKNNFTSQLKGEDWF